MMPSWLNERKLRKQLVGGRGPLSVAAQQLPITAGDPRRQASSEDESGITPAYSIPKLLHNAHLLMLMYTSVTKLR